MVLVTIVRIVLVGASPLIVLTNVLILSAWFRFKRLRTPSNSLIVSLAAADCGFGLCLPMAVIYQLFTSTTNTLSLEQQQQPPLNTGASNNEIPSTLTTMTTPIEFPNFNFNIRPFSILVVFSVASLLSIGAIALDRFTSVAQPLRYNHFVTTTHVQRFIAGCWLYAFVMGILTHVISDSDSDGPAFGGVNEYSNVSAGGASSPPVLLLTWLFFLVYLPCMVVTFFSYGYIYLVARSHARAIYSVEVSLHHHDNDTTHGTNAGGEEGSLNRQRIIKVEDVSSSSTSSFHHRYGLTLALIISMFLISWLPLLACAVLDCFCNWGVLEAESVRAAVSLPILCNSLVNPWLYGFRSSEMRMAVVRMCEGLMTRLTGGGARFSTLDTKGGELTSCASNVRLMAVSPTQTTVQCCSSHNHDRNHLTIMLCDQTQL